MSGFGDKFRTARELRGIDFSRITQETRISARFLRAIENEAFEELPGGLFNRGFVRTYAEAVGLDPDTMVEEYIALTEKPAPQEPEASAPKPSTPTRGRYILPAAAGGLVVLALILYAGWRGAGSEEIVPASTVETAEATQPETGREPRILPPLAPMPSSMETADAQSETSDAAAAGSSQAILEEAVEPARFSPDNSVATAEPIGAPAGSEPEQALAATTSLPRPQAPTPTRDEAPVRETAGIVSADTQPVNVRVELRDTSWMYVELDGEIKYENIVIRPPFYRNYTVNEALELKIGNPSGAVLSVNGQTVPSPGPSDEVWSLTITPENASSLTGSL